MYRLSFSSPLKNIIIKITPAHSVSFLFNWSQPYFLLSRPPIILVGVVSSSYNQSSFSSSKTKQIMKQQCCVGVVGRNVKYFPIHKSDLHQIFFPRPSDYRPGPFPWLPRAEIIQHIGLRARISGQLANNMWNWFLKILKPRKSPPAIVTL